MTDKQIIIDGIDVSECRYFNGYQRIVRNNECIVDMQNACIEEIKTKPCSQKHNCYFKNWQRKEQECKNNKIAHQMELDIYNQACLNLQEELKETFEQLDQLKAENEELKKQLESTKGLVTVGNKQLAEALKELQKYQDKEQKEKEENQKLYKKLEGSCLIGKHWKFN